MKGTLLSFLVPLPYLRAVVFLYLYFLAEFWCTNVGDCHIDSLFFDKVKPTRLRGQNILMICILSYIFFVNFYPEPLQKMKQIWLISFMLMDFILPFRVKCYKGGRFVVCYRKYVNFLIHSLLSFFPFHDFHND